MFGFGSFGAWPVGAASVPGTFAPSRLVSGCGAGIFAGISYGIGTAIIAIAILILVALAVIF